LNIYTQNPCLSDTGMSKMLCQPIYIRHQFSIFATNRHNGDERKCMVKDQNICVHEVWEAAGKQQALGVSICVHEVAPLVRLPFCRCVQTLGGNLKSSSTGHLVPGTTWLRTIHSFEVPRSTLVILNQYSMKLHLCYYLKRSFKLSVVFLEKISYLASLETHLPSLVPFWPLPLVLTLTNV
jgi:hypothetical protein